MELTRQGADALDGVSQTHPTPEVDFRGAVTIHMIDRTADASRGRLLVTWEMAKIDRLVETFNASPPRTPGAFNPFFRMSAIPVLGSDKYVGDRICL